MSLQALLTDRSVVKWHCRIRRGLRPGSMRRLSGCVADRFRSRHHSFHRAFMTRESHSLYGGAMKPITSAQWEDGGTKMTITARQRSRDLVPRSRPPHHHHRSPTLRLLRHRTTLLWQRHHTAHACDPNSSTTVCNFQHYITCHSPISPHQRLHQLSRRPTVHILTCLLSTVACA